TKNLTIGATRNWSRTVLEWNLAADSNLQPHTKGGCDACLGALTIDGDNVKRNAAYYIIAHASKLVVPGSKRVESSVIKDLPNVAFITPQGETVLILLNNSKKIKTFSVQQKTKEGTQQSSAYTIPAQSVVTLQL
ncbi:MAG: glucosylceramidase, partial [Flavobacteriales bacterium]